MLRRGFDKPVINLHELTNGLHEYYNPTLNSQVLGKPKNTQWGYYQTLGEIEQLLAKNDHYKTSRLAHYHIVARRDTIGEQLKFYEYLNENFYIIGCRRENLFEHALSWAIHGHSKVLNVYSAVDKIEKFSNLYYKGISVNRETLDNYLKKYKDYIEWSNTYFNVQSYFNYDTDIHKIEDYILNLDFMQGAANNKWQDMFGQNFNDWNACHRLIPNLFLENRDGNNTIALHQQLPNQQHWKQIRGTDWPESYTGYVKNTLPVEIKQEINAMLPTSADVAVSEQEKAFLTTHIENYKNTDQQLQQLVTDGFLVSSVPIKLQSLKEKQSIIKNFDQCIEWYNQWVDKNQFGSKYSQTQLLDMSVSEEEKLNLPISQQNLLQ